MFKKLFLNDNKMISQKMTKQSLLRYYFLLPENLILWRAAYAPADRQTSWGVLHPY